MNKAVLEVFQTSTAMDEKNFLRPSSAFYDILNELKSRFTLLFESQSGILAETMCRRTEKVSKNNVYMSLKEVSKEFTLSNPNLNKPVRASLSKAISENVSLIKTIPQEHFNRLSERITKAVTDGNGQQDILNAIKEVGGITDRKVKNIAADQTRKAYNAMNKERLTNLGVKKFEWLHTGGNSKRGEKKETN